MNQRASTTHEMRGIMRRGQASRRSRVGVEDEDYMYFRRLFAISEMEMSCLIPAACVFCRHYHEARNEWSLDLPSCDAFDAIPDQIFIGGFDHGAAYPGDRGVRFSLIETERESFLELNDVRRELGLPVYRIP